MSKKSEVEKSNAQLGELLQLLQRRLDTLQTQVHQLLPAPAAIVDLKRIVGQVETAMVDAGAYAYNATQDTKRLDDRCTALYYRADGHSAEIQRLFQKLDELTRRHETLTESVSYVIEKVNALWDEYGYDLKPKVEAEPIAPVEAPVENVVDAEYVDTSAYEQYEQQQQAKDELLNAIPLLIKLLSNSEFIKALKP